MIHCPYIPNENERNILLSNGIQIKDQNGNILLETTVVKSFQSVVISLEAFEIGSTYEIIVGTTSNTVTLSTILTNVGGGGMGGQGGRPPGGGGRPPR